MTQTVLEPRLGVRIPNTDCPTTRHSRLKRAGLQGLGWSGLAQVLGLAIRLGSNLLLTRLLAPQAYALLGTAMTVLTLLEWLSDLGIQPALLRHPRGSEKAALLTGWWMGLGRGFTLSALGVALAVPVAMVTGTAGLASVLACLSLRPILLSLRSPGYPLLRRDLRYRDLFLDEVLQTSVGTAASLILAWYLGSVWSLVGGTLVGTMTTVLLSYLLVPLAPRWCWDREISHELWHFGGQVLFNTLIMALWMNLDRLVGIRLIGLDAMGCYFVAWNFASAAEALLTRVCDVQFAVLARLPEEERSNHERKVIDPLIRLLMPLGCLGAAIAPVVCRFMFDERYAGTGWLLAILVARLLVRTPGQIRFQSLLAAGRVSASTAAYGLALLGQAILLPLLGWTCGAPGVAFAVLGSTLIWTLAQTCLAPGHGIREYWWLGQTLAWAGLGLALAWVLH